MAFVKATVEGVLSWLMTPDFSGLYRRRIGVTWRVAL
jgi:hypothetical protein